MAAIHVDSQKWLKKSLQAYLEGEQNLRWIDGILRGERPEDIRLLLDSLPYGLPERHAEIEAWFDLKTCVCSHSKIHHLEFTNNGQPYPSECGIEHCPCRRFEEDRPRTRVKKAQSRDMA